MVVVVQELVDCIPGKYCDNCDRGSFLCLSSRVLSYKKIVSIYCWWMHVQDAGVVDDVLQKTSYVQKIAAELLDTERKYVEKLHLVDQVLMWCFHF